MTKENVDMRAHPGVDGILHGHREYHHHNLFAQHLGRPSCGHDQREYLLPGSGRGSRFHCMFADRDQHGDRDSSTYVLVTFLSFVISILFSLHVSRISFSTLLLGFQKLTLSSFPAISIHSPLTTVFNDRHARALILAGLFRHETQLHPTHTP